MKTARSSWHNPELDALRAATARFLEGEFVPRLEKWIEQGSIDRTAWNEAGTMGLLCASIPEIYGGAGGSFAHEAVITEELEYAGIGINFGHAVHAGIVAHYVLAYGSEAQKQRWLPQLASGAMVGAIAMSEPNAGSDLQGLRTRARADGDELVLTGQKTFITNGQHADLVIVVARTNASEKGSSALSLVVVDGEREGFRKGRNLKKIGIRASDTSELFFDEVRVPRDNLLGAEGAGFACLMQQLPQERLILAVGAVAAMERAVALTSAYVKERKAFGRAIAEFQNTRFELAECKTEATVARVFVDECIERHLRGELDNTTASMAKLWCTERQNRVIDRCLQLFGGYGYMQEYPIARMFADARVQRIYGGTSEIMKELIARSL
ncbi:MAG: acyl-CoA dehydrogenase family protein [Gammaproteobacteria bacterium]|nr:acyl-CoA dehydrogenase family protein [Gammaproteobacteria bacterium]